MKIVQMERDMKILEFSWRSSVISHVFQINRISEKQNKNKQQNSTN